jgi:deoxyribodipyrimidine photo-lyase
MLEGLKEARSYLAKRGLKMVVQAGAPADIALSLGRRASMIICDRGYLRHQKKWRTRVAQEAGCRVVQVESNVIVPLEVVSGKAEYAARTIRPKIHRNLSDYLINLRKTPVKKPSLDLRIGGMDLTDLDAILKKMSIDRSVPAVSQFFKGGTSQAKKIFKNFLRQRFSQYLGHRNQPQTDDISHMSPYLHFGQISPLYLALQINKVDNALQEAKDAYLEELIVRRELAMNFVNYTKNYDAYVCLPQWAQKTLCQHQKDKRDHIYIYAHVLGKENPGVVQDTGACF